MRQNTLETLPQLIDQGTPVIGLESPTTERQTFLLRLHTWANERNLPLYLWNPGYLSLQSVRHEGGALSLQPCEEVSGSRSLESIVSQMQDGVFVLENVPVESNIHLLHNAVHDLPQMACKQHWILLSESLVFPSLLIPLIPKLSSPLPRAEFLQGWLQTELAHSELRFTVEELAGLTKACLGLPLGELQSVLARSLSQVSEVPDLVDLVVAHKIAKLRGRGLEFINEPDVPAGGLDLLEEMLDRASALLSPEASNYGLSLPKGIILWGPPGTGKSLSAKHAAKKMGVPLIAADWGGLISSVPGESETNLRYLIEIVEVTSPVILYWDDFDKAFAGWDSDAGGGVQRRLAGKLLTWLQERTAPVYVIATVNRLEMLPAELNRRFDDIVFVDLPHAGARRDIFDIHLRKYTQAVTGVPCEFTDKEWHVLLRDYNLCTAAEIGLHVRKAAESAFYEGRPGNITLDDLIYQRSLFVPQMIREEEQLLDIRKRAGNARPASSPDRSRWKVPPAELFDFLEGESA